LTQQVQVLSELVTQKENELRDKKDANLALNLQLQSALTDLLSYQDLRLQLDRETRLRQTLEQQTTDLNALLST
jgi:hypothetical protein